MGARGGQGCGGQGGVHSWAAGQEGGGEGCWLAAQSGLRRSRVGAAAGLGQAVPGRCQLAPGSRLPRYSRSAARSPAKSGCTLAGAAAGPGCGTPAAAKSAIPRSAPAASARPDSAPACSAPAAASAASAGVPAGSATSAPRACMCRATMCSAAAWSQGVPWCLPASSSSRVQSLSRRCQGR